VAGLGLYRLFGAEPHFTGVAHKDIAVLRSMWGLRRLRWLQVKGCCSIDTVEPGPVTEIEAGRITQAIRLTPLNLLGKSQNSYCRRGTFVAPNSDDSTIHRGSRAWVCGNANSWSGRDTSRVGIWLVWSILLS